MLEFGDRLPVGGGVAEIGFGLEFLTNFTLSYRGMVQHRVRRVLEELDPDRLSSSPDASTEEMLFSVSELVAETLYRIETVLEEMAFEPREAIFAVVEEFRDRVLRSPYTQDEWRTVYESLRTEVWADEFEALAANTALFTEWNRAVDGLAAAAGGR